MKTSILRKLSCLLLCMLLIFALTPANVMAFAETSGDEATVTAEETTDQTVIDDNGDAGDLTDDPAGETEEPVSEEPVIEDDSSIENDKAELQTHIETQDKAKEEKNVVQKDNLEEAQILVKTDSNAEFANEMQKLYAIDKTAKLGIYAKDTNADHIVSRVIVKGEPEYNGSEPLKIVEDPNGYYIVQFATPSEAENFVEAQSDVRGVEWAELDDVICLDNVETPLDVTGDYDGPYVEGSHCGSWGTGYINADTLQEYILDHEDEFEGRQVLVAVVDSGCDMTHPFLEGRLVTPPEWTDSDGVTHSSDFIDGDNEPLDGDDHGTHVAGTIVDCTYGLDNYISILPVRVFNDEGKSYQSSVVNGVYYAAECGADVMNLSLLSRGDNYLDEAVIKAVNGYKGNEGCVVCNSSGNDTEETTGWAPARLTYPGVIVTSAMFTESTCRHVETADFSNYGETIDISMPGVDIRSSLPMHKYEGIGYGSRSGTSMAAPHASAAAALAKILFPEATPGEIEEMLKASAKDFGLENKDIESGYGVVDLTKLLGRIKAPEIVIQPESVTIEEGEFTAFSITADGALNHYQWEYRWNESDLWKASVAEGNDEESLCQFAAMIYDGCQYRCHVTNPQGDIYSDIVTLSVTPRTVTGPIASGSLENGLTWMLDEDMVLTINGSGDIPDYERGEAAWYPWHDWISTVQIPEVTRIGDNAFADFTSLSVIADQKYHGCIEMTGAVIPETVKSIGKGAFYGCINLCSLSIPESVSEISERAFAECTGLKTADIRGPIAGILKRTFYLCINLESITISSIHSVETKAFYPCSKLKDVYYIGNKSDWDRIDQGKLNESLFSANVHFLGSSPGGNLGGGLTWAYNESGKLTISGSGYMPDFSEETDTPWYPYTDEITEIVLDYGVRSIGDNAFSSNYELTSISIPDTVERIGEGAFFDCNKLVSIDIPETVTEIHDGAFLSCDGMTDVVIPDSVEYLGKSVFHGCSNLRTAKIGSADAIREKLFKDCILLSDVTVSESVSKIEKNAFLSCDMLTNVLYAGIEEKWNTIEIDSTGNEALNDSTIYFKLTDDLFWNLNSEGILRLMGEGSMSEFSTSDEYPWFTRKDEIRTVFTEEGVQDIGEEAFSECENLESVYIARTVTKIYPRAFFGCEKILDIYYSGTEDEYENVVIENGNEPVTSCAVHYNPFGRCGTKLYWIIDDDGTLTIDGKGDMTEFGQNSKYPWFEYKDLIKTVVVGRKVTGLGRQAFANYNNIEKVVITGDNLYISDFCFYKCTKLETIILKEGVTEIGLRAFYMDSALVNVSMTNSITDIGQEAFYKCTSLNNLFYTGSEEEWASVKINNKSQGNKWIKNIANKYFNYTGPIINVQPSNADVVNGAEVTMSVEAIGIDPEYQWYRKAGSNANWIPVEGGTDAVYVFNATSDLDGNSYYCELTDEMGSTASDSALLSVSYSVPVITKQPLSMLTTEGRTVTFSVAAKGGGLHYQWQKKMPFSSQWIDMTGNGADTPKLKVTVRKSEANCQYRCKVTNLLGTTYSNTCKAGSIESVIKPPIIRELR